MNLARPDALAPSLIAPGETAAFGTAWHIRHISKDGVAPEQRRACMLPRRSVR